MSIKITVRYSIAADKVDLSRLAADYLLEQIQAAVAKRGRARIALSGGSTPKEMFARLADVAERYREAMPWSAVEVYWVDERCVPPSHIYSNFRMTQEELLELVPIPKDQIFRMEGELEPEVAASRYEAQLRNHFRIEGAESPRFDVIALGLGDDGHTASIFPHTKAVHEFERLVVANYVPQKDSWRITLTCPVINQGRSVFFLISGADKAVPLQRLVEGPRDPDLQPSQLIRPANGNLVLLCDVAATANLRLQASSGLLQIGG